MFSTARPCSISFSLVATYSHARCAPYDPFPTTSLCGIGVHWFLRMHPFLPVFPTNPHMQIHWEKQLVPYHQLLSSAMAVYPSVFCITHACVRRSAVISPHPRCRDRCRFTNIMPVRCLAAGCARSPVFFVHFLPPSLCARPSPTCILPHDQVRCSHRWPFSDFFHDIHGVFVVFELSSSLFSDE